MFRRSLLLALAALAVAAPGAHASALGDAFIPTPAGVHLRQGHAGLVFTFGPKAAKLYRSLAGKRALLGCGHSDANPPVNGLVAGIGWSSETVTLPRRRAHVDLMTSGDVCAIATRRTKADKQCLVLDSDTEHGDECVRVALAATESGAAMLDAKRVSYELVLVPIYAALLPDVAGTTPVGRLQAALPGQIAALATTDASPPAGQVGYFDDGHTVVVAALLANGTRRFVSTNEDTGVYSTNDPALMGGDASAFTLFG